MAANETIRTEDVVEILDIKILTTRPHTVINVAAREDYDSVLDKISGQVPTAAQKAAFDNTLSAPSASNPVVLKDDIQTYVPQADLGDVKDAVATFAALPLVGNTTGDLRPVIADNVIYRWNGTAWTAFIRTGTLDHTQLTSQNGDSNYQHLTATEYASLTGASHVHGNMAVLPLITSAGSGQIITVAERARLPSTTEKQALAGTSGAPSSTNKYVTTQDPRLNTVRNPYVTVGLPGSLATFTGVDFGPFEDALAAIYTGSANSVKAVEVLPGSYALGGVVLSWTTQTSALVLEAFTPHSVTLSFQTLQASIQALLPGTGPLTIRGFIFELNDLGTSGVLSQRANTLIENCIFRPGPTTSVNQIGVILEGDNSVVRHCVFENELGIGVQIKADNCRVEECVFDLTSQGNAAVHVTAASLNALVDHNTILSGKIKIDTGCQFTQVTNNYFVPDAGSITATVSIASPAVVTGANFFLEGEKVSFSTTGSLPAEIEEGKSLFVRNRTATTFNLSLTLLGSLLNTTGLQSGVHTANAVDRLLDLGYSTRSLGNQPEQFNQPYIGRIRTVGPSNSFADFRGDDESPFMAAFEDPDTTEIEVLEGTYTFTRSLVVPVGVKVKGTEPGTVTLTAAAGVGMFTMEINSALAALDFVGSNTPLVIVGSVSGVTVENCRFELTASNSADDWGLVVSGSTDCIVKGCTFDGVRGLSEESTTRVRTHENTFAATAPHEVTAATYSQIKANFYTAAAAPTYDGNMLIVEGNHFLGTLPTKTATANSVWNSNYPVAANNNEGVDVVVVGLDGHLEPLVGAVRSSLAGAGTLSFPDTSTSTSITLPILLPAKINTALGFDVELNWSSSLTSGDVMWEATVVYKDDNAASLGSSAAVQQLGTRTGATTLDIDTTTVTFTNLDYGGTVTPTHVSVTVARLGANPGDTMATAAHLVGARITLPRD